MVVLFVAAGCGVIGFDCFDEFGFSQDAAAVVGSRDGLITAAPFGAGERSSLGFASSEFGDFPQVADVGFETMQFGYGLGGASGEEVILRHDGRHDA